MSKDDIDTLTAELTKCLENQFGLKKMSSWDEVMKDHSNPCFVSNSGEFSFRIARHFDVSPSILIHYEDAGILGLVYIINNDKDLDDNIRKYVDQAAYARHLFAISPDVLNENRVSVNIELLIVIAGRSPGSDADPTAAEKGDDLREIGEILQIMARDTDFFHAIGINVLIGYPDQSTMYRPVDLRRAFPWLLQNVRIWFGKESNPGPNGRTRGGLRHETSTSEQSSLEEPAAFQELTLTNYRTAGTRRWRLETEGDVGKQTTGGLQSEIDQNSDRVQYHIVHGYNGSGKSAAVEALELSILGRIESFPSGVNYDSVIRHRGSTQPAHVAITDEDGRQAVDITVADGPPPEALATHLKTATSFRLNQRVMDDLTRAGRESERAREFLLAFSPDDHDKIAQRKACEEAASKAFESLPADLRQKLVSGLPRTSADAASEWKHVLRQLAWLQDSLEGKSIPSEILMRHETDSTAVSPADCLPLPLEKLKVLANVVPELGGIADWTALKSLTRGGLHNLLSRTDAILRDLVANLEVSATDVRQARDALWSVRDWMAKGAATHGDDAPRLLNAWLDCRAAADLTHGAHRLASAFESARSRGWSPDAGSALEALAGTGPNPGRVAELQSQLGDLEGRRDTLRERVFEVLDSAETSPEATPGTVPESGAPIAPLTDVQIAALDRVGPTIVPGGDADERVLLGHAVAEAMRSGASDAAFRGEPIGDRKGWAEHLLERLDAFDDAIQVFAPKDGQAVASGVDRLNVLSLVLATQVRFQEADEELQDLFQRMLGAPPTEAVPKRRNLIAALNELMALFTPARWAYRDLALAFETGAGGRDTELKIKDEGGAFAELRLNTAELNLFVLSLFLLRAPLVDNRLQILILDDPLQNMDELTTATVARGLSKLANVLPNGHKVLILLHGEDDLERFRREIPASVYRIPWLSPDNRAAKSDGILFERDLSMASVNMEAVRKLIAANP